MYERYKNIIIFLCGSLAGSQQQQLYIDKGFFLCYHQLQLHITPFINHKHRSKHFQCLLFSAFKIIVIIDILHIIIIIHNKLQRKSKEHLSELFILTCVSDARYWCASNAFGANGCNVNSEKKNFVRTPRILKAKISNSTPIN